MPIVVGFITGFLMCIPVGPVNLWVINASLKKGFPPALSIAGGDALMSFIYFMVISAGFSFIHFDQPTLKVIHIVGITIIFIMGMKELICKPFKLSNKQDATKRTKKRKYFLLGIIAYVTNPTLIITISGICAFIRSSAFFEGTLLNHLLFSFFVSVGTMGWFYLLLVLLSKFKRKMTDKFISYTGKACGILLIGLASYMSYALLIKG